MPRPNSKRYQKQMMLAISIYMAVMLLVWPLVQTVRFLPLKTVIALTPLLPMLYVIALIAKSIRDSDELEQHTHLIGLGVATAVAAVLSVVGGFLASAQVLAVDGSILIWVFPAMMACYSVTRWWIARPYSGHVGCDPEHSLAYGHSRVLVVVHCAYGLFKVRHIASGRSECCGRVQWNDRVRQWRHLLAPAPARHRATAS